MKRITMTAALALFAGGLLTSAAYAKPLSLSDAQMDQVAAGGVSSVDGFVCPVITTDAVLNASNGVTAIAIAGGHYSIVGPDVSVPLHATNDGGAGSPGGAHAAPGDSTYTAIWAK